MVKGGQSNVQISSVRNKLYISMDHGVEMEAGGLRGELQDYYAYLICSLLFCIHVSLCVYECELAVSRQVVHQFHRAA
jgi:hypothetical protein